MLIRSRVPIVTNERLRRFFLRSYNIQYHGLSLGIPSNIFCIGEQEQSDFHFVPRNAQTQADAVWAETGAIHIPTLFGKSLSAGFASSYVSFTCTAPEFSFLRFRDT